MTRPVLWFVPLAACSGASPLGTAAAVDEDGDGYAVSAGDCDDRDPAVNPAAIDRPGDGMDQDCADGDALTLPARALAPGDVRITEVLRDPVGVSPDLGEWFELHNGLDVAVDLAGAWITDGLTDTFVVAEPLVLEAGGYAVVGAWDDPERNGGVEVDLRWTAGFGLTNAEDRVRLEVAGAVVDEVGWDPTWPRLDGYALSFGPDVWCLARPEDVYGPGGRGTPGAENPPCPEPFDGLTVADLGPGDLVITEILQNPAQVDGDFGEWFELYVGTDEPVDLAFLVVEDDSGDAFEVLRPLVVQPGDYVVFASFVDGDNGGVPADAEWRWDFGLANSGDTIRVLAGTTMVDEVAYDDGATFPDAEGASMSLDPDAIDAGANDVGGSWCEGVQPYGDGDLGTPGRPNPPCG